MHKLIFKKEIPHLRRAPKKNEPDPTPTEN